MRFSNSILRIKFQLNIFLRFIDHCYSLPLKIVRSFSGFPKVEKRQNYFPARKRLPNEIGVKPNSIFSLSDSVSSKSQKPEPFLNLTIFR